MVSTEDRQRLNHIISAIEKIDKYTAEVDYTHFESNEMLQDAIFKNLEIIGEAAYKVTAKTKEKHDHIEWRKIEGLRHKLVHDYYKIDLEIVWQTKDKSLPKLHEEISVLLK